MISDVASRLANWKANPRRWQLAYIGSRANIVIRELLGLSLPRGANYKPLDPPIETGYVNLLTDPAFLQSVSQVKKFTCLDVVRLANIWNLVHCVGPGVFLEVGSYHGGTALHICNALDEAHLSARFYSFDPFEAGGFEEMIECDRAFKPDDFTDTQYGSVAQLLSCKPNATVVKGFFPAAAEGLDLHDIAFCHLDVDIYQATRKSLEYLAPRLARKGMILVDDVGHFETPGVNLALSEFVQNRPSFIAIPMFPVQSVLLPKTFFET